MRTKNYAILGAALCIATAAADGYADLRVKSRYTTSGQTTETTIYVKGERQRFEPGPGFAIIHQHDLKRSVQLMEQQKSYLVTPAQAASSPSDSNSTGGVVNYTLNIIDTGEQKTMFGHAARRIKSTTTREAGPGSCNPGNEVIETDGWYIDYEPGIATKPEDASSQNSPAGCRDEVRHKQIGSGKLGYPLSYTLKTTKDDKTTTMEMEVIDFSIAGLDAALFEVPAGYNQLQSFTDLRSLLAVDGSAPGTAVNARGPVAGTLTPKAPGAVRVGVANLNNRSGKSLGPTSPRDALVAAFASSGIDAIPLDGQSATDVETAARKLECDYVAYAEVAEVKKPSGGLGKFGGMLNKAASVTGGGPTKEKIEAKVDYKLMPVGGSKPAFASSATGSNGGGFNMQSAFTLAMNVTTFSSFMKMGMFNPNMMQALGSTGGLGMGAMAMPGMPRGGLDPGLGSFASILQTTQSMLAPAEPTEEGKAVSDAIDDAAKKMSEALKKKKS